MQSSDKLLVRATPSGASIFFLLEQIGHRMGYESSDVLIIQQFARTNNGFLRASRSKASARAEQIDLQKGLKP